jgi:hypothetical protein
MPGGHSTLNTVVLGEGVSKSKYTSYFGHHSGARGPRLFFTLSPAFEPHISDGYEGEAVIGLCQNAPKRPIGRTQPRWLGYRLRAIV